MGSASPPENGSRLWWDGEQAVATLWSRLCRPWRFPLVVSPPVDCVVKDRFAAIEASIEGGPEFSRVRLYFRSPYEPDFLYVDMTASGGRFVGALPRPRPRRLRSPTSSATCG